MTPRPPEPKTSPTPEAEPPAEPRGRSVRRAAYLTAGTGIAFSVLFVLSFLLMQTVPGPAASDQEIIDYFSGDTRLLSFVGVYLMPFAGIAFIWFIVALRMWIQLSQDRANELLSNVQLVVGILFVGLMFVASAAWAAVASSLQYTSGPVDPDVAREFPEFGNTVLFVFAMRMAAMFVITTTGIGQTVRALPRWLRWVGYVLGVVLLLSFSFNPVLVLAFPAWMLVISVLLYRRGRDLPDITVAEAIAQRSRDPSI